MIDYLKTKLSSFKLIPQLNQSENYNSLISNSNFFEIINIGIFNVETFDTFIDYLYTNLSEIKNIKSLISNPPELQISKQHTKNFTYIIVFYNLNLNQFTSKKPSHIDPYKKEDFSISIQQRITQIYSEIFKQFTKTLKITPTTNQILYNQNPFNKSTQEIKQTIYIIKIPDPSYYNLHK